MCWPFWPCLSQPAPRVLWAAPSKARRRGAREGNKVLGPVGGAVGGVVGGATGAAVGGVKGALGVPASKPKKKKGGNPVRSRPHQKESPGGEAGLQIQANSAYFCSAGLVTGLSPLVLLGRGESNCPRHRSLRGFGGAFLWLCQ